MDIIKIPVQRRPNDKAHVVELRNIIIRDESLSHKEKERMMDAIHDSIADHNKAAHGGGLFCHYTHLADVMMTYPMDESSRSIYERYLDLYEYWLAAATAVPIK